MNTSTFDQYEADFPAFLHLFQQQCYDQIVTIFSPEIGKTNLYPNHAHVYAAALVKLGNYSGANEILSELESALSDSGDFLSLYGIVSRRLGNYVKAESLLLQATRISPDSVVYKNNYANVLIDQRKIQAAVDILLSIVRENPNYDDAQINLKRAQLLLTKRDESQSQINNTAEHYISFDPLSLSFTDEEVLLAGKSIRPDNPKGANDISQILPKPTVDSVSSDRLQLASKAVASNNPVAALDHCKHASSQLGANPEIYLHASDAYIQLKSFHEAEICLLHSMMVGIPSLLNYINLISLLSLRADLQLANFYLDKALKDYPNNPNLLHLQTILNKRCSEISHVGFTFPHRWDVAVVTEDQVSLTTAMS